MNDSGFTAHHLNAGPEDLAGNRGLGRYLLLPGSDGRARVIGERFSQCRVRPSERGHNLYLGTLDHQGMTIEVAAVASGMGTPSLDIIVQELFSLGVTRFLRVGTAGSLQPGRIRVGDLVTATAAVRDEGASRRYAPVEFPAVASAGMAAAVTKAAGELGLSDRLHPGIVHSKDSLFAREFGRGPMAAENRRYMEQLAACGVVASEMESSHLFVLASLFSQELAAAGRSVPGGVLAGALLGIIGDHGPFASPAEIGATVDRAIDVALLAIKLLAVSEAGAGRE